MNTEPSVIEVNHLVHKYGRTEAVNDLSLRVQRGQCYGFFGRNGAGKTTTIKCLLNLLRPAVRVGPRLRPGPGQGGGRGQVAAGVRAGLRGVLPVDDRAQRAGLPGVLPAPLEPANGARAARAIPAGREPRRRARCPAARRRSWRSWERSAPSRSCWCWTSRPRAWIRSCAASSSRR